MTVQHGGNVWQYESNILDFSASLSPLGMPPAVREAAIRGVLDSVHYPDPECAALRRTIAAHENLPADWIACGNGAADLLDRLAHTLKSCKVLTLAPSFGEYERSFLASGGKVFFFYLKERDGFALTERFFPFLHPGIDLIVLCNPNNPTGQTIKDSYLLRILDWCRENQARLLVDESFLDLTDNASCRDLRPLLEMNPQLLLLRSLTKSYCMPGLRLGYLLTSDQNLLNQMKLSGQPWTVSVPAQYAGIAALQECSDWPDQAKTLIQQQRALLRSGMEELGLRAYDSQVNYLLFRAVGRTDLRERLLEKGILIRSCASFRGLSGEYYRIAVRTEQENRRFLTALGDILSERSDAAWQDPS